MVKKMKAQWLKGERCVRESAKVLWRMVGEVKGKRRNFSSAFTIYNRVLEKDEIERRYQIGRP